MTLRSNCKALGLALIAMLALGAIAAGAAQANSAPRWTVKEGGVESTLVAGESRTIESSKKFALTLKANGITFESNECAIESAKIFGSPVASPGTFNGVVKCEKMEVAGHPACNPHSAGKGKGIFETNTLQGTLVWLTLTGDTEMGLLLTALGGGKWGELQITECIGTEVNYPIEKELLCKAPGTGDAAKKELECPGAGPLLKYFSNQTPRVQASVTQLTAGGFNATWVSKTELNLKNNVEFGTRPG